MSLEDTFKTWAKPPSVTEREKADNAERIIRETLNAASSLDKYSLEVFPQGSYRARTNVRQDSDVDICVLCTDEFFYDLSFTDIPANQLVSGNGTILPSTLRSDVEKVLVASFGRPNVTRGNKAFDIHANTYRLDADVVVAFRHKRFLSKANGGGSEYGIEFVPDKGPRIINWPEQNYDNGVAKNAQTSYRYKAAIRILKRTRNAMQEKKISEASNIASFLIESLVWNVPDDQFDTTTYVGMMQNVLAHTYNDTRTDETCEEWGEVNERKYLFRPGQGWTREQAKRFLDRAWTFLGYK